VMVAIQPEWLAIRVWAFAWSVKDDVMISSPARDRPVVLREGWSPG
jgi:hypothetical protein